jgi:hypothetical protein
VLAKLDGGGDAMLIERRFGRGRVAMFTVPLDRTSGTLPFSNLFLPMMQSLTRYLAAADLPPRNLLPGQPIQAQLEDASIDRATLTLPDGSRVVLEPTSADGDAARRRVRYDQTSQPGRYELRWRTAVADRVCYFVVRPPMEESDLTPVTNEQWTELRHRLNFELTSAGAPEASAATPAQSTPAQSDSVDAAGREVWPLALGALAVMLLVESALGRTWSAATAGGGGA